MQTVPRVVITGVGLVNPLGRTVEEYGDGLFGGRSAISPLEGFEVDDPRYPLGGQVKGFDMRQEMPEVDGRRMFRFSQFSLVAAKRALLDSGIPLDRTNRDRMGTAFSTAAAGLPELVHGDIARYMKRGIRGVSPTAWSEFTPCACTCHVAITYGLRGPSATHSSGCVSGIDAIGWGVQQIREGRADVMLVGGADAPFMPFVWAGYCRSGILAPLPEDGGNVPRPFSHDHAGIALAEGGSAVLLESEAHARLRGARIRAEIAGVASFEEALPMSALDPTGEAFALTMRRTLADAGQPITSVDWVIAHGTGYAVADCSESHGIETALGAHAFAIPVSSIRGAIGQPISGGGGLQVAAACEGLRRQMVAPTINFSRPADGCRLDYVPNEARASRVRRVLINVAGVGGTHGGMLVAQYER